VDTTGRSTNEAAKDRRAWSGDAHAARGQRARRLVEVAAHGDHYLRRCRAEALPTGAAAPVRSPSLSVHRGRSSVYWATSGHRQPLPPRAGRVRIAARRGVAARRGLLAERRYSRPALFVGTRLLRLASGGALDLRQMCARDHGLVSCQSSGPWRVKGEGQDTVPAVPRTALPEESMLR
jgi:hypothetical protein